MECRLGGSRRERRLRDVIAISISKNWFAAPFAEHGRRNAQRVFIPLQFALRLFLKGEKIFPRLLLQAKEARRRQDIPLRPHPSVTQRKSSPDTLPPQA